MKRVMFLFTLLLAACGPDQIDVKHRVDLESLEKYFSAVCLVEMKKTEVDDAVKACTLAKVGAILQDIAGGEKPIPTPEIK